MSARVYLLLDILEGKTGHAIQTLRHAEGVIAADTLEGNPDILAVIEAPDRQKLVELMMPVLQSLDHITEDLHLLMTRQDNSVSCFFGVFTLQSFFQQVMN
jgi:hypothetical protein